MLYNNNKKLFYFVKIIFLELNTRLRRYVLLRLQPSSSNTFLHLIHDKSAHALSGALQREPLGLLGLMPTRRASRER